MRPRLSFCLLAPALLAATVSSPLATRSSPLARRPPSLRWNFPTHEAIAAIAWAHLTPAVRATAVRLLRSGPPLAHLTDLEPRDAAPAERDRALFLAVATWADRVRGQSNPAHAYDRGPWHYADYFWREENGIVTALPAMGPGAENALERLALFKEQLRAGADTARAVALAWTLHLVGDVHQPLHLSSRVTPALPNGDRGGNEFKLAGPPNNLHGLWDGILTLATPSAGEPPRAYVDRLAAMVEQHVPFETLRAGELASDFTAWGRESLAFAQRDVYAPSLREGEKPGDAYAAEAARLAERRVALAGYRLATLLNEVLR